MSYKYGSGMHPAHIRQKSGGPFCQYAGFFKIHTEGMYAFTFSNMCCTAGSAGWGSPAPLGANLTKGLKCCLMNSASDMIAKYTVQIFASIARHHVKHP